MNKKHGLLFGFAVLFLAAIFTLTGCPTGDDGSNDDVGSVEKGVLGQVSGVVYDTVTGQSVEGVTVEISGSSKRGVSDKNGAYLIKDVLPGEYTLSFSKSGYRFQARSGISVLATDYKTDDPFGEWQALQDQLQALQDWVNAANIPTGVTGDWTYTEGGVWIDGSGTAVTIQSDNGEFKVVDVKMDYTYRKGIEVPVTGLTPLSGAIKGQIKLFKVTSGDMQNVAMADAVPIDKGIQVWFLDSSSTNIDLTGAGANSVTPRYGPVSTGANGSFECTGLPVGVSLTLVTNGFSTADGYSYAANAQAYSWGSTSFTNASVTAQNTRAANQHTNVGDIYLFTAGNYALINESSTGSIDQPIIRNGTISLSFSKPINPGTFSATLNYGANAVGGTGSVSLSATWSADAKQVTLAANIPSTGVVPGFPYCSNGTLPVGTLQISGKATDGSSIFAQGTTASTTGIPVYTAAGVQLLDVDINPASASLPTSRAAALSSRAIKLTFSKPLNKITSTFNWKDASGNRATDFTFADSNKTVYVWTDLLPSSSAGLACSFEAAADPFDTGSKTIGGTNGFTKAPTQQKLILESTNIYEKRTDPTKIQASDANFPVNEAIKLTFSRAIPAGAIIWVTLSTSQPSNVNASSTSSPTITVSGAGSKTLTITPATNLSNSTTYYVAVEIISGTEVIFSSMTTRIGTEYQLGGYDGIIAAIAGTTCQSITFNTSP